MDTFKTICIADTDSKDDGEIKMRVETKTWNINDDDLNHIMQLDILNTIHKSPIASHNKKYISTFITNLKNKLSSYKQQDLLKKKYNLSTFVTYEQTLQLLVESNLLCHYCHKEIYILYKRVREMSQWSLDRIDNDIGHDFGNLVISCLKCNLKRRRINKNFFMFTRNMIISRENYTFDVDEDIKNDDANDETDSNNVKIIKLNIDTTMMYN